MHSDTNVNVRAARNLVNTVHATREQQRSALLTLEHRIVRKEIQLRRLRRAGIIVPGLLAGLVVAAMLAAGGILVHADRFHPHGWQTPLLVLLFIGVPTLTALLTAESIERRLVAAAVRVEHLRTSRVSVKQVIARMNLTVKESEQELADRERAAA